MVSYLSISSPASLGDDGALPLFQVSVFSARKNGVCGSFQGSQTGAVQFYLARDTFDLFENYLIIQL